MAHILHVDASPRAERSISRALSNEFIAAWHTAHPEDVLTYRDLGHHPVPHVTETWVAAAFSPPETHTPELTEAIQTSDVLVDELFAADRYVFGVPMYNLSVPSTFKAYIDQIVRIGRTFAVEPTGYKGLIEGKKALIITAQGGTFRLGSETGGYNFHEPYLRAILGFIGVTDVSFIYADGLNLGDETREKSLESAHAAIQTAIATW
ncbi:MAG: FMN-dependent NADH-azoreductase [Stenomitos rutilans HA7619-LM2]|nr:FMN-dependent NADH-azoreductase [Stenomitos rutilans HA7619-LM2]